MGNIGDGHLEHFCKKSVELTSISTSLRQKWEGEPTSEFDVASLDDAVEADTDPRHLSVDEGELVAHWLPRKRHDRI